MCKKRGASTEHWATYRNDGGTAKRMYLNLQNAEGTAGSVWPTVATSSLITIGTAGDVNDNNGTYVMWCWHSVDGYSKIGSYIGNGTNGNGPFVYTGFRPAWVMIKNTDNGSDNWNFADRSRLQAQGAQDRPDFNSGANYTKHSLSANLALGESHFGGATSNKIDFLSNGFKPMDAGTWGNTNTHEYFYIAFAEFPFKYTNAR